jgi:hypothetical protein
VLEEKKPGLDLAEDSDSDSHSDNDNGDSQEKEKDIIGSLMGQTRRKSINIEEVQDG